MKKFLLILFLSFLGTFLSLLVNDPGSQCSGAPSWMGCIPYSATRGFPVSIPTSLLFLNDKTAFFFTQATLFLLNVIFYFLIFSVIYFVYSKLTRKAKKK